MQIDARTAAVITVRTGYSNRAIRDCLAGRTSRTSTRIALLNAARELGLARIADHVAAMLVTETSRAA